MKIKNFIYLVILIFNFQSLEVKSNGNELGDCFKFSDIDYSALCIKSYWEKNIKSCKSILGYADPKECTSKFLARQGILLIEKEYFTNITSENKYNLNEYKLAGKLISKAVEISPNRKATNYTWLGHINIRLRKYQEAINYISKGIYLDPDIYKNYNLIAYAKRMQGNIYESINYHTLVIENDYFTNKSLNYERRGDLKNKIGDKKGACDDWQKAMALGSNESKEYQKKYCNR